MKHPSTYFGERADLAERFHEALLTLGIERGLLGPREGERLWERHILNSLPVTQLIPHGASVIDVGSGAGLPGIPLALARPDLHITLLEPLLRRATFLEEVVALLGLEGEITVVRGRAEEIKGRFDIVTARAVAPLERLVSWTWGLVTPGGALLALKGESAADELEAAHEALARVPGLSYALHHPVMEGIQGVIIALSKEPGRGA